MESDLFDAVCEGREDDVVALIASGVDVSAAEDDENGWTPLHHACVARCSGVGIVRILIEAGADVNKRTLAPLFDGAQNTPLVFAVLSKQHETVKVLLAAGAGPNCERSYRYAVRDGCRHMLRLLLQHRVPMIVPEDWRRNSALCMWEDNDLRSYEATWAYHDKIVAAGGYDALVKKHREILASVVDKVVEAKFRRRAPKEVCAHVALFIAPPGGF